MIDPSKTTPRVITRWRHLIPAVLAASVLATACGGVVGSGSGVLPSTTLTGPGATDATTSTTPTDGSSPDFVQILFETHELLTEVGRHLLEVAVGDFEGLFTDTTWEVTITEVGWRSPASQQGLATGDIIEVTIPEPLEWSDGYERASETAWVTIDDDLEVQSVGVLDTTGVFIAEVFRDLSWLLAPGAKALPNEPFRFRVQVGFCPDPSEPPAFESEPEALVAYFHHLDNRPVSQGELLQQASAIEARTGGLVDPVTGHVSAPDLNDLVHQLEQGIAEEDLVLRPALPLLVQLEPVDDPLAGSVLAVVFTALPSNRVLGWMSALPHGVVEADGTNTWVWETLKFIAPPEPHETVAVHVMPEDLQDISCIHKENPEPLFTIPHDDIAGDTRVIVDVATATYETTTELPPG